MSNGGLISGAFSSTSGLATSVITTRGDIIRGNAAGNRSRYAIGSAGTVLASDGTDPSWTASSALKIPVALEIACSDEGTALTTGTAKVTFRMPYAMTLSAGESGMRASLTGAGSSSGTTTIDVNETGSPILSTKCTIDYGDYTSVGAGTPVVINDTALADNAQITVDIDVITGGANETGLKIQLIGVLT